MPNLVSISLMQQTTICNLVAALKSYALLLTWLIVCPCYRRMAEAVSSLVSSDVSELCRRIALNRLASTGV